MMIAVAVAAIAIWAYSWYSPRWPYYVAGWWDAERELWRGEATIYGLGGVIGGDICNVDEETGLPIHRVSMGCVICEGDRERVQGHNDRIEQSIRAHGLPANTLKPWEKELFHLKRYFDERSPTDGPKRLQAGGPAVVSPDGESSVRLIAGVKDDGSPSDSLKVLISAGDDVLGEWYVRFDKGDSDLIWGPEGSRLAVIRSISEKTECYEAYDLKTGRFLSSESWVQGKPRGDRQERISVPPRRKAPGQVRDSGLELDSLLPAPTEVRGP
jgi:hypothetical protein